MSKNLVREIKPKTQSEITAKLLDCKMPDALLNNVSPSFTSKKDGSITAEVAKARYHTVTKNQTQ
jgi:hypothetical protein